MGNFAATLRWIDEADLDPYQSRLLLHYWRRGQCWESQRVTADSCKISLGQVSKVSKWLLDHGYIEQVVIDGRIAVQLCSLHEQTQQEECSPHEQRSPHEQEPVEVVHHVNAILNNLEELNNQRESTPLPPKSKTKRQKAEPVQIVFELPVAIDTPQVRQLLEGYQANRLEKKKPLTQRAVDILVSRLTAVGLQESVTRLQTAILNDWQGVFYPGDQEKYQYLKGTASKNGRYPPGQADGIPEMKSNGKGW